MSDEDNRPIVLVVDDEPGVLKLIYRQLVQLPYKIIPTTSPAEAMHLLETLPVAMLLCDLNMPHTDGNIILVKARDTNPDIVSVAISGGSDYEATIKAVNEGGIWKYIQKPWNQQELLDLVTVGVERFLKLQNPHDKLKDLARTRIMTPAADSRESAATEVMPARERKRPRRVLGHKTDLAGADTGLDLTGLLGDRYSLGGIIGEGGLGTVYKATDLLLNMPVAVKVLNAQVSTNERAIATLKEEARIAMQLSHKHIVRLHNIQQEKNHYYLVMEYVKGHTLWDVMEQHGPLALDSVLQIVYVCSDAISYAHRRGVLHRDLKPDNLLLDENGILKIIDFGIACLVNTQKLNEAIMGTPAYMSPEQIRGERLDARTDVYSMGVIVFELLAGQGPLPDDISFDDVLEKLPLNVSCPQIPTVISDVIAQAVAPDREERWGSMYAFSSAMIDAAHQLSPPAET
jgi:DNA-binding response OmpR family regulator